MLLQLLRRHAQEILPLGGSHPSVTLVVLRAVLGLHGGGVVGLLGLATLLLAAPLPVGEGLLVHGGSGDLHLHKDLIAESDPNYSLCTIW